MIENQWKADTECGPCHAFWSCLSRCGMHSSRSYTISTLLDSNELLDLNLRHQKSPFATQKSSSRRRTHTHTNKSLRISHERFADENNNIKSCEESCVCSLSLSAAAVYSLSKPFPLFSFFLSFYCALFLKRDGVKTITATDDDRC